MEMAVAALEFQVMGVGSLKFAFLPGMEFSWELDWEQEMVSDFALTMEKLVAELLVDSVCFSEKGLGLRQQRLKCSCRSFAGHCCGSSRGHVKDAQGWQRLSEDTGDTLVKDMSSHGRGRSMAMVGSKAAKSKVTRTGKGGKARDKGI